MTGIASKCSFQNKTNWLLLKNVQFIHLRIKPIGNCLETVHSEIRPIGNPPKCLFQNKTNWVSF